jgi:hypothetical protein
MSSPSAEEAPQCGICFTPIDAVDNPRGVLNSCTHVFCNFCIAEWSTRTNVCPQCKTRFTRILTVDAKSGETVEKKVRRRNYRFDDDDGSEESDDEGGQWEPGAAALLERSGSGGGGGSPLPGRGLACSACGNADEVGTMVLCKVRTCTHTIHWRCLHPAVPLPDDFGGLDAGGHDAAWKCASCRSNAEEAEAEALLFPTASFASASGSGAPAGPLAQASAMTPPAPSPRGLLSSGGPAATRRRARSPSPDADLGNRLAAGSEAAAPARQVSQSPAAAIPAGIDVTAAPPSWTALDSVAPARFTEQRNVGLAELARRKEARALGAKSRVDSVRARDQAAGVTTWHVRPPAGAGAYGDGRGGGGAVVPPGGFRPPTAARRPQQQPRAEERPATSMVGSAVEAPLSTVRRDAYTRRFAELRAAVEARYDTEWRMGVIRRHGPTADADIARAKRDRDAKLDEAAAEARRWADEYVGRVVDARRHAAERDAARQAIQQAAALRKLQHLVAARHAMWEHTQHNGVRRQATGNAPPTSNQPAGAATTGVKGEPDTVVRSAAPPAAAPPATAPPKKIPTLRKPTAVAASSASPPS